MAGGYHPAVPMETATCPGCGGDFVRKAKQRRQIYCSKHCVSWHKEKTLPPTILPSEIDVAWAAGIYEGEGTIKNSNGSSPHISICQKDTWILHRLRERWGGSVLFRRNSGHLRDGIAYWSVSGFRCRAFTDAVHEYLSPRRQAQIDAAMFGVA